MGIFSRKRNDRGSSSAAPARPAGRKLSTDLEIGDCRSLFQDLASELAGYGDFSTPDWCGAPGETPDVLVAAGSRGTVGLYLAVWNRGGSREMHLVPASTPDQLPPAMIGSWKMKDRSLSSTGTVTEFPVR